MTYSGNEENKRGGLEFFSQALLTQTGLEHGLRQSDRVPPHQYKYRYRADYSMTR
jgi:hypothetical protein